MNDPHMKRTSSYQIEDGVARRIRQMAIQYSDRERVRITQGEVIKRAVALLDKELNDQVSREFDAARGKVT
jgi:hypothetical protein